MMDDTENERDKMFRFISRHAGKCVQTTEIEHRFSKHLPAAIKKLLMNEVGGDGNG